MIKYGKNQLNVHSHTMNYNSNIIEMMDIKKNITTIILGFKLDNNSTLQYLIYDVIRIHLIKGYNYNSIVLPNSLSLS